MTMTTIDRGRIMRALLRSELAAFVHRTFQALEPGTPYLHSWHHDHLAWQLRRVARGEFKRLIINVPPRSMKSITVSVAFSAWLLGHDPTRRIIAVSYAADLARKLSLDTRSVMESGWFRELFPDCILVPRRQRDLELSTTLRGGRLAVGLGGGLTGRGADVILVDDPMKAIDAFSAAERRRVIEFYEGTLVSRLNDKANGAIVVVMQRLHADDLCGYLRERAPEDWTVVELPAMAVQDEEFRLSDRLGHIHRRARGEVLQPEREPRDVLEGLRRQLGTLTYSAQYQQAPVPAEGNVIRRSWLRYCAEADWPEDFERVVVSWDTASTLGETSDWSVGTVWGALGLDYYLLDVVRERLEAPELRREIVSLSRHWRADATLIEDTELGRALRQDLRRTGHLSAILHRSRFDKEARLLAQAARFEAGQVHLPADAPWLADYVGELLAFPNGRHDDQVDSTSQALDHLTARTVPPPPLRRRNPVRREIERR
ncbi:phage terminase large subunit [Methylobacterium sp. J-048]|uniref:phage terminase large subunit n=1 Tax=Methylobacterium sp. J-048 TaxID=2836635 RepID=UPI001FB8BE32|nr:phage terminase large subunit [Methylobacterium sp. J-048]MCJ2056775.1 phage terminase large subunit [Methylobacterium sp. J-048]